MNSQSIYTVGGTVQAGDGLYIRRKADEELLHLCRLGDFAYVLTSRQMGKSSLMVRTAQELNKENILSITIDLSGIGTHLTADQWYFGLIITIAEKVGLRVDVLKWWEEHYNVGVAQRLITFFRKVLLAEITTPVVIFIDEIDTTLSLEFADDFYAAIRYIYNNRPFISEFKQLSFVLIGVATPSELIRDTQRTPFNIGQQVDLTDFTLTEALPLARGLHLSTTVAKNVLGWVIDWTGGHPYLTQRLCRAIADSIRKRWSASDVEDIVQSTFLGEMSEKDHNLQFVREMLTERAPDLERVLYTYWDIWRGRPVRDEEQSIIKSHLKLSGVAIRNEGVLCVRNLIYKEVFNVDWVVKRIREISKNIVDESIDNVDSAITIQDVLLKSPKESMQDLDESMQTFDTLATAPDVVVEAIREPTRAVSASPFEQKRKVFISSTARDLPDHRQEALDACLRQGMFPLLMEYLPASDADAIEESLRMVDEAGIYLGIFAHRYGYVPDGHEISITEMEYNRAVERGIPRLIFLMHDDHPIKGSDVEKGPGALKLEALKARLAAEQVVNFYKSSADLRAHVIDTLSQLREPNLTAFHYVRDIPAPPEPYIAHPYVLLQSSGLIGRQPELNVLTDWVTRPTSPVYAARTLNVVAIGGMGKSALTWKWFNDIAPREMQPLAGRLWWSFYESDAHFENFVIRSLAYVSKSPREDIEKNTKPGEREDMLLRILDREPFLLVLDGLERILIAYARIDAAHLQDDDYDKRTANYVAGAYGLPASAAQSFVGEHKLRKAADPRAGNFLRKLARVQASRILVSSRLYPAELQNNITGDPIAGSFALFLRGLSDDDALDLWRAFGVSGARDELLPLFRRAENHPLVIQALAAVVARYRAAPGDFARWRHDHPNFDPLTLPLVQAKSHILEYALRGLDEQVRKVLYTVAAFRMPAHYDTLAALLVDEGKPFTNEKGFDAALAELEERGLLGWDRRANRYDLHPIVRGVTWSALAETVRQEIYAAREAHFESLPTVNEDNVNSLDDLAPAIELYHTLIGLGRYDDAFVVFRDRLNDATLYRLSASRQRADMLELLFPDGLEQLPHLESPEVQSFTLNGLALGYKFSGQPERAIPLFRQSQSLSEYRDEAIAVSITQSNLADPLRLISHLYEAEAVARRALCIARDENDFFQEAVSLSWWGLTLAMRGEKELAFATLEKALQVDNAIGGRQAQAIDNAFLAQSCLWSNDITAARSFANRAWELAKTQRNELDNILSTRLQGVSALYSNDLTIAEERLFQALTRARAVNLLEEELPALTALAELRRRQDRPDEARALLDDVWEAAERGPYPLFHADALNVLAQIERDAGNTEAAIAAATKVYTLAWCDGPPFAYHWGLEAAKAHLQALGAPEPQLPPFDESKYEPMPEVEIDPPDAPEDAELA